MDRQALNEARSQGPIDRKPDQTSERAHTHGEYPSEQKLEHGYILPPVAIVRMFSARTASGLTLNFGAAEM